LAEGSRCGVARTVLATKERFFYGTINILIVIYLNTMQKITPNLWFNGNAKEAVDFYASVFSNTKVIASSYYPKSKEEGLADFQQNMAGEVLTIDFEIMGFRFVAINAGPEFTPNPSISFTIVCKSVEEVDVFWHALMEGGQALMKLDEYPFSKRYGWLNDKYGVSWQIIVRGEGMPAQPITPGLMFTKENVGRAEEAMEFYASIFPDSKIQSIFRYENQTGEKDGNVAHALFSLQGQEFIVQESAGSHNFTFNEGVSLSISCQDQDEIDYYWEKFTTDGGEESVCGWLKDKYGVSWQVVPENMDEYMKKPGAFKIMMGQKKIIISEY
jgi:predicted 3-demethylubiquinone-9 3-methyltransferase (glyoxalase superfamily)